ncbi:MAG: hypothetical protein ACAI35_20395 [Candidatus Methylacidiphilales bacterium]|nr:hypothetical protein [Candidatus Methylacidiphilales bacterium]
MATQYFVSYAAMVAFGLLASSGILALSPATTACAQGEVERAEPVNAANSTPQAPFFNRDDGGFEQPNSVAAAWFLPEKLMSGPRHRVRQWAMCDGINVTYQIDSDYGFYEVFTTTMVQERVAEIYAIAKLKEMAADKAFMKGASQDATGKLKAAGKIVTDPKDFFESIPKGASRMFGDLGESMKGRKSKYEDKAYTNLLGASTAKRRIAFKLGVNPYSSNAAFQDALNEVAWSEAAANLVVNNLVGLIPFGIGTALNINQKLQNELIDCSAPDLRIRNRKKLLDLGISRDVADKLLFHPWYSPVHNSVITECLADVGGKAGPSAFINSAAGAWNEADAQFFTEVAELLSAYHSKNGGIVKINPSDRLISFIDKKGRLVFPVPFDYGIYTERISIRLQNLSQMVKPGQEVVLYTTGQISALLKEKLKDTKVKIEMVKLRAQEL